MKFPMTRLMTGLTVVIASMVLASTASAQVFPFLSGPRTPPALAQKLDKPVSAKLVATLTQASHAGLRLNTAPVDPHLRPISGPRVGNNRKVGVLYVGADFCPYCAGQRWGLMLTLLRFGKFSGLHYMLSSASDVYANTPTVTFQHARYQSRYVSFHAVETTDRDRHSLMMPNAAQTNILDTFDAPPYVRFAGSIPFVYVDGRYLVRQLLVRPTELTHMDWQQIATTLANPDSTLFRSVMPRVNLMTAAICHLDGGKPADVCTAPGVVAAKSVLDKLPAPMSVGG